ncbi:HNH endonuclease signature motif containing protein [Microbacterium hydrocarbonoxydans]|uniref:HNH endonuclease signature motif containing protein n=1 Tax=Microbacterium hydrocarbonoxydans TaxID=273678 RepID=UPI00203F49D6|nr:HNH endonuclease signature motif containing protein [Microbacterium hydrocarbonoxydans]MCM3779496.1 HNH endonuclease [Microbacterium hydrocarbonoxydans]
MTALADATVEQMAAVGALTATLVAVDRAISSLMACRDGLLASGARIALETVQDAEERDDSRTHDLGEMALRAVAAEFAAALHISDRTVQRRMADAELLVSQFPVLWQAQGDGRVSAAHSRVIIDAGLHLDDADDRGAYTAEMLEWAQTESPNRLARRARRVADRLQRRTIDERHRSAREQRAVWVKDRADGMAELGLLGPAALVHGAYDRITAMAKSVAREETERTTLEEKPAEAGASTQKAHASTQTKDASTREADARGGGRGGEGDLPSAGTVRDAFGVPRGDVIEPAPSRRSLAQIRCDLTLDLVLTGAPAGHDSADGMLAAIAGSVSVTVPVQTLMGTSTMSAELDGRIPIDAATARRLAGDASGWDRILTHPIGGRFLAVDRYRPSAELKRHLRARDQRCRFPGCGQLPRDCDIDHTQDHALGGSTGAGNLGTLCRRHHSLKHHTPWHVEHLGDGLYAWTSPTGRTYVDAPPAQNTGTNTDMSTAGSAPPGSAPPAKVPPATAPPF